MTIMIDGIRSQMMQPILDGISCEFCMLHAICYVRFCTVLKSTSPVYIQRMPRYAMREERLLSISITTIHISVKQPLSLTSIPFPLQLHSLFFLGGERIVSFSFLVAQAPERTHDSKPVQIVGDDGAIGGAVRPAQDRFEHAPPASAFEVRVAAL